MTPAQREAWEAVRAAEGPAFAELERLLSLHRHAHAPYPKLREEYIRRCWAWYRAQFRPEWEAWTHLMGAPSSITPPAYPKGIWWKPSP